MIERGLAASTRRDQAATALPDDVDGRPVIAWIELSSRHFL